MKVLVVGSGGREHALVKAIKKSSKLERIWIWPGNDGILLDAEAVPVQRGQYQELANWCTQQSIDLVVVGPEAELVGGISDVLRKHNIRVFGPSQAAAQLEGSKVFAKEFMKEFGVPTARSKTVTHVAETMSAAAEFEPPYVLKADGLAAGKGVFICETLTELENCAKKIFNEKLLGSAGEKALLEEFQGGEELSVLILTNGKDSRWLPLCRDHKRLLDGDKGPNTGGMGVVGPIKIAPELKSKIDSEIVARTIAGISNRNYLYHGVIFIGIMLTESGPSVLEYNVRFGDPETQVILPQLNGDWLDSLNEISIGQMPDLNWHDKTSVCVVLAAEGYPNNPISGVAISGLAEKTDSQVQVLHAGTRREGETFLTNGGRVLNVVATADKIKDAITTAYSAVKKISWPGMQFRKDLGKSILY